MNRKLTNMIWRNMGESILLCLFLFGVVIYILSSGGFLRPFETWQVGVKISLMLIGIVVTVGAVFGYWYTNRVIRRLDQLREAMLYLEKGNLSRTIPPLGEDEIGRLGEQL